MFSEMIRMLEDGRLPPEKELRQRLEAGGPPFVYDVDWDGNDELVFIADGTVRAFKAVHQELWQWPLPNGRGDILGIFPASAMHATVMLSIGRDVLGLDA